MGDARAQVTGRVDGVAGGAAQAHADDDDDHGYGQWAQAGGGLARGDDPGQQDEGAHGLGHDVPAVGAHRRAGGEHAELGGGVGLLVELLLVGQPHGGGARHGAHHLGGAVDEDVDRRGRDSLGQGASGDRQADGHRRVEVRAGLVGGVDTHEDRQTPRHGDDDPAAVLGLGGGQHDTGDDAAAQKNEKECPQSLRGEDLGQGRRHVRLSFCTTVCGCTRDGEVRGVGGGWSRCPPPRELTGTTGIPLAERYRQRSA